MLYQLCAALVLVATVSACGIAKDELKHDKRGEFSSKHNFPATLDYAIQPKGIKVEYSWQGLEDLDLLFKNGATVRLYVNGKLIGNSTTRAGNFVIKRENPKKKLRIFLQILLVKGDLLFGAKSALALNPEDPEYKSCDEMRFQPVKAGTAAQESKRADESPKVAAKSPETPKAADVTAPKAAGATLPPKAAEAPKVIPKPMATPKVPEAEKVVPKPAPKAAETKAAPKATESKAKPKAAESKPKATPIDVFDPVKVGANVVSGTSKRPDGTPMILTVGADKYNFKIQNGKFKVDTKPVPAGAKLSLAAVAVTPSNSKAPPAAPTPKKASNPTPPSPLPAPEHKNKHSSTKEPVKTSDDNYKVLATVVTGIVSVIFAIVFLTSFKNGDAN